MKNDESPVVFFRSVNQSINQSINQTNILGVIIYNYHNYCRILWVLLKNVDNN